AITRLGIKVVGADDLLEVVRRAIAANPRAVADFKKGKAAAANAIKGAIMREAKGAARPRLVEQLLTEEPAKGEGGLRVVAGQLGPRAPVVLAGVPAVWRRHLTRPHPGGQ